MKLRGAEAVLEIDENVKKKREKKNYRHPDIDSRIRNERTEKEARIIRDARKNNVNVPEVEAVDENTLEMEKIEGEQLKDILPENVELMENLGEQVAKLHEADIVHGDLTTRNVIAAGKKVFLIDFGLSERSQRIEDRAVDLHLLKQVLQSSHPGVADKAWNNFLEGYTNYEKSGQVLERLEEVESRGRYK